MENPEFLFDILAENFVMAGFYHFFRYLHSGFRFIVLALVLLAILQSFAGWLGKKPYTEAARKTNLFGMIMIHTQVVIGLTLYFLSPLVQFSGAAMKVHETRYWTVEHISMMLIAMAIVTIGHSRSKKAVLPEHKYRAVAISFTLGLIIICAAIVMGGRGGIFGMTR